MAGEKRDRAAGKESGKRRTKTKNLPRSEQELTTEQSKQVEGGAKGAQGNGTGPKSLGELLALVGTILVKSIENKP